MRNRTDKETFIDLQLIDPIPGAELHVLDPFPEDELSFDQFDVHSPSQSLQEDLAELPQAFAAYLNDQQNRWS